MKGEEIFRRPMDGELCPKSQLLQFCQLPKANCPQEWEGIDFVIQLLRCDDLFES